MLGPDHDDTSNVLSDDQRLRVRRVPSGARLSAIPLRVTRPLIESLNVLPSVITRLRRPTFRSLGLQSQGLCHACGTVTEFTMREVLWPALVNEWRLTPVMKAALDRRESRTCLVCNNNYRNRQLARALVEVYAKNSEASVSDLTHSEHFRSLRILGIDLDFLLMLEDCPGFSRSDYITSLIPVRGLPDNGLPFADASFDLVLVSDTLEHIPTYRRALQEIRRVLTLGGQFVTVQPVILSRKTLTRCAVDDAGNTRHLLPPSYHARKPDDSLVFVEFGIDFIDELKAAGLDPSLYFYNVPADDYAWVAVCKRA
jgi:SAM-dependent methyltransferase